MHLRTRCTYVEFCLSAVQGTLLWQQFREADSQGTWAYIIEVSSKPDEALTKLRQTDRHLQSVLSSDLLL